MQIEIWRRNRRLTEHHVHLASMMRLVVEDMCHRNRHIVDAAAPAIVHVLQRATQKAVRVGHPDCPGEQLPPPRTMR